MFSLPCSYPMHGFARKEDAKAFCTICDHHRRVLPTECYRETGSDDRTHRIIAGLPAHSKPKSRGARQSRMHRIVVNRRCPTSSRMPSRACIAFAPTARSSGPTRQNSICSAIRVTNISAAIARPSIPIAAPLMPYCGAAQWRIPCRSSGAPEMQGRDGHACADPFEPARWRVPAHALHHARCCGACTAGRGAQSKADQAHRARSSQGRNRRDAWP